ncbi:MAG: hypothetical protein KME07_06375 [Pegethrix bostrychoides GSE-TBD4-15B]|jgi:hypothetical protein|uniref:HNH nuclease domain-containing protein n=1 Tax=Pegethrix bostrychoides GSE-TBD4-15B TaxID=2839662 RepID=A0A951P9Y0_9CYAN|nr:hypothetical protein [Pegethrix bostrychoides GSE-TBD4-15B]
MVNTKHELLSAEETAKILDVNLKRLYAVCTAFDARNDDEWDLIEGEHFEWLNQSLGTRIFYEEGAMAIAKYLQETARASVFSQLFESVIERLTHRRKRIKQMLVRRRIVRECQDGVVVRGELVFVDRRRTIRILDTNGKGLNAARKREQENDSLDGRNQLKIGKDFDIIDGVEYWSQSGMVRIAKNMSEKLAQKSRKAWTEAVCEVYEDAINQQRKYLDSFDARVQRAMDQVKAAANRKCQVTLERQRPHAPFDMHIHHLFDRSTRPDLAARHDNLLAMHEDIHQGFHKWHGSSGCEPQHFVEYLTSVEGWRFEKPKMAAHLQNLMNRFEKLQRDFENRPFIS